MGLPKGRTNNLHGRPKKGYAATDIIQKQLKQRIPNPNSDDKNKTINKKDLLFDKLYSLAIAGDSTALKLYMEYGFGRVPTSIDLNADIINHIPDPISILGFDIDNKEDKEET